MGIHNYDKKLEQTLARIKKSEISEKNKEILMTFKDNLVLKSLSKSRIIRYLQYLIIVIEELKEDDITKLKESKLKKYISNLQQSEFTSWTKQTYKVIIRKFFQWIAEENNVPSIADWICIRISRSESKTKQIGDMITQEEIKSLIKSTDHSRDKAIIATLAESGARVSELGNLLIKNVHFDEYGVLLSVHGKTGSRTVRLIWSVPYLTNWLNNHPFGKDREATLWVHTSGKNKDKPISYSAIRKVLISAGKRAKLNKKIHPHLFRHSLASYYAGFLTEFQMNQFFGWIQGSKMAATYVHMNGKNVDDAQKQCWCSYR